MNWELSRLTNCGLMFASLSFAMQFGQSFAMSDVHKKVKEALVVVVAEAQGAEGSRFAGAPLAQQATGFFVSPYGHIVTSYHLISNLGDYDPTTLKLSVITGDRYANKARPAGLLYFEMDKDIAVLKTPEGDGFRYLKYQQNARAAVENAKVFTSGYPRDLPYKMDSGQINAFDGPGRDIHVWMTDMVFVHGQSGSPVYLEDGAVIGVVKGTDKKIDKHNFLVPIDYFRHYVHMYSESTSSLPSSQPPSPSWPSAEAQPIGRLSITAHIASIKIETRELEKTFQEQNEHCKQPKDIRWQVRSDEGWNIDTKSVHAEKTKASIYSDFSGVTDLNQSGFILTGKLRNNGDCVNAFGRVFAYDGRGYLSVKAQYTETREVNATKQIDVMQKEIGPGFVEVLLPENTRGYLVHFTRTTGEEFVATAPGSSGPLKIIQMQGRELHLKIEP
jgi:hypothetical protein